MTTYAQLQQQLANDLKQSLAKVTPTVAALEQVQAPSQAISVTPPPSTLADNLIDALPAFADNNWRTSHKAALANCLCVWLQNDNIAPHPSDTGFMYSTFYEYSGPYSGYKDAFYGSLGQSVAGAAVYQSVLAANAALTPVWWAAYGLAVLTDAARQKVSMAIDTTKLTLSLSGNNANFLPALAASYLGNFEKGYLPTANSLAAIQSSNQTTQVATMLNEAIANGQFTANINQAIAMGGDSTNAATWFLFNLWISLKALGYDNVDAAISSYQNKGLTVPPEVGPQSWWNGGYSTWYAPLNGGDISAISGARLTASMPEKAMSVVAGSGWPVTIKEDTANGYALSLCQWGTMAIFKASSGSCFGKETPVRMADGSFKAIETIRVGEEVQSDSGNRKVILVESPLRFARPLYQINDFPVQFTAAHPFRTGRGHAALRCAIDPWALIDGIPRA